MSEQKIKVSVERLAEAVRARVDTLTALVAKEQLTHDDQLVDWKKKAATQLEKAMKQVEEGKTLDYNVPTHPDNVYNRASNTSNLASAKRHLAMLEMASDTTVTITGTDFSQYVGL